MLSPLLIRRGNFNLTSKILKQFIKLNHTKSVQDLKFTSELYPNLKRLPFATIQAEDLKFFENELGKSRVITDQDEVINFSTDWMKMFKGSSPVVLKPKTTDEISKILNYCNKRKIAVCPQGGNTGLVGGSVPVFDEVILNMSLMNQIIKMDDISGVLECQAGCVLENLEKYANEYGFIVPIDLGAKGSCQIGGNVSTNAGGLRFLRYGSLHGNVLGLEIVLANGEILDCMNSMKKDNTGYDLKQLFIGAEGTLGVVTKVSIQCPPTPKSISLAFLGTTSFENVLKTFKTAKEMLSEVLSSFELMDSESIEPVERFYNLKPPISPNNFYMLIETSGSNEKHDEEKLSAFLEHLLSKGYIEDGTLAASPTHAKSFWQLRESIAAALQLEGSVYKYDISLPLKYFYEIVPLMKDHLKHTKILTCCGFGHVGDCNLHLNMTKAGPHDTTLINDIESFLYKYIMEKGGSISAEHGIGFRKRDALIEYKSRTSLNVMKKFKIIFDPHNILNPYKLL